MPTGGATDINSPIIGGLTNDSLLGSDANLLPFNFPGSGGIGDAIENYLLPDSSAEFLPLEEIGSESLHSLDSQSLLSDNRDRLTGIELDAATPEYNDIAFPTDDLSTETDAIPSGIATLHATIPEIPDISSQDFPGTSDTPSSAEDVLISAAVTNPNQTFNSGVFKVDETGNVGVDFLFDGGWYKGELAIFSLAGMEQFNPGSPEFIKEAARRALSNSELGHLVISDPTEGARFAGELGESNFNAGEYQGVKTFTMTPGDEFGVMMVPNGTVQEVFENPTIGGAKRTLFSMSTANPLQGFHLGQIADVTGEGNTFVMEDMRVDGWTDKDYNDLIFQVRGAIAKAALMDDVVAPGKDWRTSDLGNALVAYAKSYINPESVEDEETDFQIEKTPDTSTNESVINDTDTGETVEPIEGISDEALADNPIEPIEGISDEALADNPIEPIEGISDEALANPIEPIEGISDEALADNPIEPIEGISDEALADNPIEPIEGISDEALANPIEPIEGISDEALANPIEPIEEISDEALANPIEPIEGIFDEALANPIELSRLRKFLTRRSLTK